MEVNADAAEMNITGSTTTADVRLIVTSAISGGNATIVDGGNLLHQATIAELALKAIYLVIDEL